MITSLTRPSCCASTGPESTTVVTPLDHPSGVMPGLCAQTSARAAGLAASSPTPTAGRSPDPVRATDACTRAPIDERAQGLAIWAWHQLYDGDVYTFLNKDGSTNPVWERMAAVAERL